jgi:hypothetical protein
VLPENIGVAEMKSANIMSVALVLIALSGCAVHKSSESSVPMTCEYFRARCEYKIEYKSDSIRTILKIDKALVEKELGLTMKINSRKVGTEILLYKDTTLKARLTLLYLNLQKKEGNSLMFIDDYSMTDLSDMRRDDGDTVTIIDGEATNYCSLW